MRKKVYIAGPMRGIPEWNFPAFEQAEKRWIDKGWQAFSPAAMDKALGYDPNEPCVKEHLQHVILADIAAIFAADAIALLSGWEKSMGVAVELSLAQFLSMPVYCAETMEEMSPITRPWKI